jgi:hypothetical protein
MKTWKSYWLIAVAVIAAVLFAGANSDSDARPPFASSERWIALSDKAGFLITSEKGDSVGAELYLKTDRGWRRGRIENPFVPTPVVR